MNASSTHAGPARTRLPVPVARRPLAALALGAAVLLGACASRGEAPTANLAVARTSLAQAEAVDAPRLAPIEYRSARDKLVRADEALRGERYTDARRLADEAAADADVAERRARAAKATATAEELQRSNAVLSNELTRTQTTTQTTVVPVPAGEVTRQTTTTVITRP